MPSNFDEAIEEVKENSGSNDSYVSNWKGLIQAIRDWSATAGGPKGDAATVQAGTTTTLPAGSDATVTNVGTTSDAVFNFAIPKGDTGPEGPEGPAGADSTVQGPQGPPGADGADSTVPGPAGVAATIAVGNVTTLTPGTNASVSNTGTTSAAVFDFGIPKGEKGDTGETGGAERVANVAAIPDSPEDGDLVLVVDSTGIESFSPLSNVQSGFTGSSALFAEIEYSDAIDSWVWVAYGANDPEARYLSAEVDATADGILTFAQTPVFQSGIDVSGNISVTGLVDGRDIAADGTTLDNLVAGGVGGGTEIDISTTPPSSPDDGNLWYNSEDGRLYIYYNDGSTSQWVDASPDSWDPSSYPDLTNSNSQSGTLDDRYLMLNSANDPLTGVTLTNAPINASTVDLGPFTTQPDHNNQFVNNSFNFASKKPTNVSFTGIAADNQAKLSCVRIAGGFNTDYRDDANAFCFGVESTLESATNGNTYNIYANGSAPNYFAGNVGIGTTSPSEKLVLADIAETSGFSDTAISMIRSNYGGRIAGYIDQGVGHGITIDTIDSSTPTERLRITGDGDVGIGTDSPNARLSVSENSRSINLGVPVEGYATIEQRGSSNTALEVGGWGDVVIAADTNSVSSKNIIFSKQGTQGSYSETMRIASDGNVGIGTSDPTNFAGTCKLAVNESGGARIGLKGNSRAWYIEGNRTVDCMTIGARGSNNTVDNPKINFPVGGGISFGTDTASQNALDDYEEGNWTPAFTGGTFTYTNQTGRYTKIGDMVYLSATISWSAKSGTANLSSSIPFTTAGDVGTDRYPGMIGYVNGVDNGGERQLVATISGNRSGIGFYLLRDNATPNNTTVQNASDAGEIQFSFVVKVR